jgi:ribosomal protein L37E
MADGSMRPSYGPHPDAVLLRRRRTHRAIVATKLAIALVTPFGAKERREYTLGKRTCAACGVTYEGVTKHFSNNAKTCRRCNAGKTSPAQKSKTCTDCGTTYDRVCENFLRGRRIYGSCNPCAEAKVRAKIEARIAKRAHSCKA